jgi:nitrite reductase/ring-hydroxylating ferredoxin subunit
MAEWVKVADLAEVTRRRKVAVDLGGERIALFNVAGRVYAFADSCVHRQRSLSKGTVLGDRVICPGHQWAFELETGQAVDRPECQPTYRVKIENGGIWVLPRGARAPALPAPAGEKSPAGV